MDRPSPSARGKPFGSPLWKKVDLIYEKPVWHYQDSWKQRHSPWYCDAENLRLILKPTEAGQLGVFPEHWGHWSWLLSLFGSRDPTDIRVLSLFAYTGATTLFLARLGCSVTHVDASRPTVQWARENCELNDMSGLPIRWVVEDARRYAERECLRSANYDLVILDPPSFGHGPRKEQWSLRRDLPNLMERCWKLLSPDPLGVLLCGHSQNIDLKKMVQQLKATVGNQALGNVDIQQSILLDEEKRDLDCGYACRFSFVS